MILHLNRASHGGQGTGELGERAITRRLYKPPFVAAEAGSDQFSLEPLELGVGGLFSALHQRGVANHVGGQDCRQSPLNPRLVQSRPEARPVFAVDRQHTPKGAGWDMPKPSVAGLPRLIGWRLYLFGYSACDLAPHPRHKAVSPPYRTTMTHRLPLP